MTRTAILVNPRRVGNLGQLRGRLATLVGARGWPEPRWIETAADDDGSAGVRAEVEAGATLVFACGGDGTVRAAAAALAGSQIALALLPAGTGNVLALNLGIPTDLEAAIELGMSGVRRRIDLGQVGRRTFAVASGIGFDAQMLAAAPQGTKRLLGWPAYLLAAVRHVPGPGFEVSMELDGQRLPPRRVRAVLVANVGRLPGGIRLLPEALPDDGLLDVALIAPSRLRDWGQLVGHVLTGSPLRQGLEVFQARQVLVSTDASQLWEIDGEPVGQTQTLRATVRPGALWVCVPPAD